MVGTAGGLARDGEWGARNGEWGVGGCLLYCGIREKENASRVFLLDDIFSKEGSDWPRNLDRRVKSFTESYLTLEVKS